MAIARLTALTTLATLLLVADPGAGPPAGPALAPAPAASVRVVAASRSWAWPLRPEPAVLQRFRVGPHRWSPGHRGVDLAARAGAPVLAPAAGTVRFAGVVAGRPVVSLTHPGGLVSAVVPVTPAVRPGTAVTAGQVIGTLSPLPGHCAPASCLHWGVRRNGVYVDPLLLVGVRPPVVLKPVS